jgi:hypothetical protein
MSLCLFFLWLFVVLQFAASAQGPRDLEAHLVFSKTIIQELEDRQYDLLESQYREFQTPGEELADGTPKLWLYFTAFTEKNRALTATIEEAGAFTQKARDWLASKPASVAALLGLCNALIGECEQISGTAQKQKLDPKDPETLKQIRTRADEYTREIEHFPGEHADALRADPQYYATSVQFLAIIGAPFDVLQKVDHDIEYCDPYYVPFCTYYVLLLFSRRQNDHSLPRPDVWLTDRFKVTVLDTAGIKRQKCRAYAQIIAFHGGKSAGLKPELLDWQTLKAGLQDLVHTYGPKTDWPTRYLVSAFAFADKEAGKEALDVIQGDYSPEIITAPQAFQDFSRWAED